MRRKKEGGEGEEEKLRKWRKIKKERRRFEKGE